jgi:hypothetical protein
MPCRATAVRKCGGRIVNQDDARDIRRCYLQAAIRVDGYAAGVARELGLTSLAEAIEKDRRALGVELKELAAGPIAGQVMAPG